MTIDTMTEVKFYDPLYEPDIALTYSVISANSEDNGFLSGIRIVQHGKLQAGI